MIPVSLHAYDALLVIDVQVDFLPGGALAVARGDEILAPANSLIGIFTARGLPVFASRDWHPANHSSFKAEGGPWPAHCVAGSAGAAFPTALQLPDSVAVISKAVRADVDAYSAFAGTDLARRLQERNVRRVTVCGLATDYCVMCTVVDALACGFEALIVPEAIRAADVQPGDGTRALGRMVTCGAVVVGVAELDASPRTPT